MKMQLMNETLRYDVICFIEIYTISKILKNFTICVIRMRDEDQTRMHPNQPLFPTTTQWLGKHHTVHTSQF